MSRAQEALKIFERLQGMDTSMVISIVTNVGDCLTEQDQLQDAGTILQKSCTLQEQVLGSSCHETLRSNSTLASLGYGQERFEEAESLAREVLTRREQSLDSDHSDGLIAMRDLSLTLAGKGSLNEGENLGKEFLALQLQLWGPDPPDFLESLEKL